MHVLNLTNIYEVCNSHICQTVIMNERNCYTTISLPISLKMYQRLQWGLILVILGVQEGGGGKNQKLFEKKSQSPFTN